MRLWLTSSLSLVALTVPALALACGGMKETAAKAGYQTVTLAEFQALRATKTPVAILDANSAETRAKHGVIPGATLLTSYDKFDVAKELPPAKDATMVFYCANTKCTASHKAAARAVEAGYTNVYVLSDGIMGWRDAGQPTTLASI